MKRIFLIIPLLGILAACQSESVPETANLVKVSPVITRATEVNFEDGDQIGLTIVCGEETYVDNALLQYSGSVFSGSLVWYTLSEETSSLTAYYPYTSEGAPTSFTVKTDQSADGAYTASDLMASTKSGVTPTSDAVAMTFKHQLTKILVSITNSGTSSVSSVVLKGSIPVANVDLDNLSVEVDETASAVDITAQQVEADATYRAIVVPQTVAFTLEVTTADGASHTASLASAELVAGGQYTVNAALTSTSLTVYISGDIENWTDEGEISEDEGTAEDALEEHLDENYIIYHGEKYATVTLSNGTTWMAQNMRYVPDGYTPSSDATEDSHIWYPYTLDYAQAVEDNSVATNLDASYLVSRTDAESIEKYGYLYDMTVAFGFEVTTDNYRKIENVQGICPDGWHVPNRAEYYDLIGATNPNTDIGETSGNKTDSGALFWDSDLGYASIANCISMWGYEFTGYRYVTNTKFYTTVVYSGNCTVEDYYGNNALAYYMTSTAYKPNTSGLPQMFGVMSTFTSSSYPKGRLSLAYMLPGSGTSLRCIKDHDIDFYAKYVDTPLISPTTVE